ncbi:unnamed protein product [Clonostachys rosea f. rosea IK726]|uniref:Uncharacterized protein n=1 Tax=Clonostachys rosea f. rosea IK726 TaxID=1349383 RepID=A0ACA9UHV3_BIOOC|nr:unnamed protein product [Clonostachys rosea f. rosea IK726]
MWREDQVVWPPYWTPAPLPNTQDDLPLAATLNKDENNPQKDSPLFRLSPEIRVRIYDLALQTVCDQDRAFGDRNLFKRPNLTGPRRIYTALSRTCRAVYAETWALPLINTSLVIHEGSDEDRPPNRPHSVMSSNQRLFYLQAWQLLLVGGVDMTFQQIRLENGGIEEWLRRLHHARGHAREIMRHVASEKYPGSQSIKDFVENSLIGVRIRALTVRVNRRDWWNWTNDPSTNSPEQRASRKRMIRVLQPNTPHDFGPYADDDAEPLLVQDCILSFVLETFGPKAEELDYTVNQAKDWVFAIPSLSQEGQNMHVLGWDGQVRNESWERAVNEPHIAWLRKPVYSAIRNRIEVRVIRFIPKLVQD